ncbi:MAG: four helix bundle protein [Cyclobacteriaceae bacterium]|nr:MAG: four helix bundle protein [Cyclobacteriaceae bacterium]
MENKSIVKEKSILFALSVIKLYQQLRNNQEYIISKQLLKCSTAIGANISEALAAESRRDFVHKMSLASKESRESYYWLLLLNRSQLIDFDFSSELESCEELIRLLTSIVKTSRSSL